MPRKGGSRPVVGRVGYLSLCVLVTRGEWIFTPGYSVEMGEKKGGRLPRPLTGPSSSVMFSVLHIPRRGCRASALMAGR